MALALIEIYCFVLKVRQRRSLSSKHLREKFAEIDCSSQIYVLC